MSSLLDKIEFTFIMEYKDVLSYAMYDFKRKPINKIFQVLGIIYIIFCSLVFIMNRNNFWYAGLAAFVIIGVFIWIPYLIRRRSKVQYSTTVGFAHPIHYTNDNHGIEVKGHLFESKLSWENIYEVRELKDMFLIFGNKLVASKIPKRSLSESNISSLRTILSRHSKGKLMG